MRKQLVLPVGESVFTKIDKPDTSFNPQGEFVALVAFTGEARTELETLLDELTDIAIAEFTAGGDKVTKTKFSLPVREEDGALILKTKTKAVATNRETGQHFTNKILVGDVDGNELTTIPLIGKGSKLELLVDVVSYSMNKKFGLSFRLKEVRIVELVEVTLTSKSLVKPAELPF